MLFWQWYCKCSRVRWTLKKKTPLCTSNLNNPKEIIPQPQTENNVVTEKNVATENNVAVESRGPQS